jgi:uncharacterized membrane protein
MIGAVVATFLTASVEWVEAYTILLAVALSIGWRRAAGAGLAALCVLAVLTSAGTLGLAHIGNLLVLQFIIGFFLVLFGVRWLGKAIARGAGFKKLHDEAAEFSALRARPDINEARAAWAIAFNGVLLEGLEVWLIVVALGVQTHHTLAASCAALAAALLVLAAGFVARAPLAKVPENTIKFTVGCGILAFGTFWVLESLGYVWPFAEFSLLLLFAFNVVGGLAVTRVYQGRMA